MIQLTDSDRFRIEAAILRLRKIADLGRNEPIGLLRLDAVTILFLLPQKLPNSSDQLRMDFVIETIRDLAKLNEDQPLGDLYPLAVMGIDALKSILKPNIY